MGVKLLDYMSAHYHCLQKYNCFWGRGEGWWKLGEGQF